MLFERCATDDPGILPRGVDCSYQMKHFQPLERCDCGAYRYLAAREHGKSFEIVLIHQLPGGPRKYAKVAGFPKSALTFHDVRNRAPGDGGSLLEIALQVRRQLTTLVTALELRNNRGSRA